MQVVLVDVFYPNPPGPGARTRRASRTTTDDRGGKDVGQRRVKRSTKSTNAIEVKVLPELHHVCTRDVLVLCVVDEYWPLHLSSPLAPGPGGLG